MALRVLHVVDSLQPEAGSVAVLLRGLFDALQVRGIESQAVSLDRVTAQTLRGLSETSDASVAFETSRGLKPAAQGPAHQLKAAARLIDQADVAHLHGWGHHLARTMAIVARKTARPFVISPHGALCNGMYNKRRWRDQLRALLMDRRLIRKAAAVTALNEPEERELHAGRVHANIVRLPYGINIGDYEASDHPSRRLQPARTLGDERCFSGVRDFARAKARGSGTRGSGTRGSGTRGSEARGAETPGSIEGRYLLMLGPIHPIEGFVPLLRALSELGRESDGWNVAIVGYQTGDWCKMLEAAVRRKGGEGRVTFASAPDVATQRAWLADASILAAPSLHVRCPVSIMQAVAAGVPVLASSRAAPPGLEDVIRVCQPSRGELKAALRSLLGVADEERVAMAQRARDAGRALFDWPALVDRYVQLYEGLT